MELCQKLGHGRTVEKESSPDTGSPLPSVEQSPLESSGRAGELIEIAETLGSLGYEDNEEGMFIKHPPNLPRFSTTKNWGLNMQTRGVHWRESGLLITKIWRWGRKTEKLHGDRNQSLEAPVGDQREILRHSEPPQWQKGASLLKEGTTGLLKVQKCRRRREQQELPSDPETWQPTWKKDLWWLSPEAQATWPGPPVLSPMPCWW